MTDLSEAFFQLVGDDVDDDWRTFHREAYQGRLSLQKCAGCARLRWIPAHMCAWCHSLDFTWAEVPPQGTLWSFCVAHPPLVPYLADRAPVVVALVALDVDPRIRLLGEVPDTPPDALEIGVSMVGGFRTIADDIAVPIWRAAVA